eukprot:gene1157-1467_t
MEVPLLSNSPYDIDMVHFNTSKDSNQSKIEILGNQLSIHHLTIEDIISHDTSEKCEEYPEYLFIATSEMQYSSSGDLKEVLFYMIIFKDFTLVFHNTPLECFDSVLKSFRYLDSTRIPSSEWVLCSHFEALNELFLQYSEQLMGEVNVLDDFSFKEELEYKELYVRLGRATRKSTNLLSNLFIKTQNLNKETIIYLNNIKDRSLRLQQKIKLSEELLENIHNVYISKVSLILNEESHALNISMRKFGSLSLIAMPLNLIAGIFGMNVRVP